VLFIDTATRAKAEGSNPSGKRRLSDHTQATQASQTWYQPGSQSEGFDIQEWLNSASDQGFEEVTGLEQADSFEPSALALFSPDLGTGCTPALGIFGSPQTKYDGFSWQSPPQPSNIYPFREGFNIAVGQAGPSRPFTATSEDISPILTLCLDSLIRPQISIFLDRIQPMIPVYTPSEILSRLGDARSLQSPTFVAMILCMAALSLVHPLRPEELPHRAQRAKQAKVLMDEACRLRAGWDHGCDPCCEGVLASYLMFGTLFELGEAAGSRLRLKEAVTMGEAMQLDLPFSYLNQHPIEAARRRRLFFVLAVTERAFALQRSGHLIFHRPFNEQNFDPDPTAASLPFLAKLFSLIDQPLVYCWNNQCDPLTCTTLTRERAVSLLRQLSGSATAVFGSQANAALTILGEVQKADLLITWQWLRNRIWRLALKHGLA